MNLGEMEKWDREELLQYLKFLMYNYRVMDAFWFINLENRHGMEEACEINELVWGKAAQMGARDLKKRFNISEGGLEAFVRAKKLWTWSILVDYQYIEKPGEVIIEVPSCPAQEGRLKHGLGEYPCRSMHRAEFEGFAHEIDPRIKVDCVFARRMSTRRACTALALHPGRLTVSSCH